MTITNGFFTGNTAGPEVHHLQVFGGGLYIDSGTATVINSLFTGNTVPASHEGYGGGIARRGGSISVRNSIVWGNSAKTSSPQIYWPESVTYSDVEGGVAGTGNINLDPQLTGNYHISAGSPCIDAGDNTDVPSGVITDLDGNARFLDDPATTDTGSGTPPIVDMGPYEYQGTVVPDLIISKSHTGNFTQGQVGAIYIITVSNAGNGPTSGTVTVTDTLPTGLTANGWSGFGWNCNLATLTFTRNDTLAAGSNYPAIILMVNVASNAATSRH